MQIIYQAGRFLLLEYIVWDDREKQYKIEKNLRSKLCVCFYIVFSKLQHSQLCAILMFIFSRNYVMGYALQLQAIPR